MEANRQHKALYLTKTIAKYLSILCIVLGALPILSRAIRFSALVLAAIFLCLEFTAHLMTKHLRTK